jgi:hypothetical protein
MPDLLDTHPSGRSEANNSSPGFSQGKLQNPSATAACTPWQDTAATVRFCALPCLASGPLNCVPKRPVTYCLLTAISDPYSCCVCLLRRPVEEVTSFILGTKALYPCRTAIDTSCFFCSNGNSRTIFSGGTASCILRLSLESGCGAVVWSAGRPSLLALSQWATDKGHHKTGHREAPTHIPIREHETHVNALLLRITLSAHKDSSVDVETILPPLLRRPSLSYGTYIYMYYIFVTTNATSRKLYAFQTQIYSKVWFELGFSKLNRWSAKVLTWVA